MLTVIMIIVGIVLIDKWVVSRRVDQISKMIDDAEVQEIKEDMIDPEEDFWHILDYATMPKESN